MFYKSPSLSGGLILSSCTGGPSVISLYFLFTSASFRAFIAPKRLNPRISSGSVRTDARRTVQDPCL
jgi:hypothetical protein